jgi:hypothetical protein
MKNGRNEHEEKDAQTVLTLTNIKYLVEGLDILLQTNVDGEKRMRVIDLRDRLTAYINTMFSD